MKKLLNVLTVMTLITSSTSAVIACRDPKVTKEKEKEIPGEDKLEGKMLKGAEIISRLIVGSRHENLNYNVNEILSMFLTPSPTSMNMPLAYKSDGKDVNASTNINRFKNYLAPSLNYYNGDGYAGMFASYIMGMYDNDFYSNIINGNDKAYYFKDTFSKSGNQGNNKSSQNAMGYAAGLGSDINLSQNKDRKNLSWAIQDTGALSNYLLNLGFDGANPTDTNGTSGPKSSTNEDSKGGTNGSGYAWYNSVLMNGSSSHSVDYQNVNLQDVKLKNQGFMKADKNNQSTINNKKFNSTGALLTKVAGEQNVNGFISFFGSMLDNISDTKNGALIMGEFTNILFPMITGASLFNSATVMQGVGLSLITNVWAGIRNIAKSGLIQDEKLIAKINSLDVEPKPLMGILPNTKDIKASALYKLKARDLENPGTNAKDIVEIINELTKIYNDSNNKKDLNEKLFIESSSPFFQAYKQIMKYIGEDNWKNAMTGYNNDGGINLLNFTKGIYSMVTNQELVTQFEKIIESFKDQKTFRDLTNSEKNKYLKLLGWTEKGYSENSIGSFAFDAFSNSKTVGQKDFINFFSGFKNSVANAMKEVHEPVLKYLVDDNYWKIKDFNINTTSNTQIGGKMEFTLNYNGVGDPTSNASKQTKEVKVNDKFNPYQTLVEHQNDKWSQELKNKLDPEKIKNSGKILGVEQNVISKDKLDSYDGLGNYQDYKQVKNSYKISWENISNNQDSPYWVITSIKCFNENGEQFYNIY